jgi:hypothetical protein
MEEDISPDIDNLVKNFIENYQNETISLDKTSYKDLDESDEKLISCPHEIVFTINANVLAENDKGELVSSKEICSKKYHIPVPIDKNYHIFMTAFFQYLENCLQTSASQAYNQEEVNNG